MDQALLWGEVFHHFGQGRAHGVSADVYSYSQGEYENHEEDFGHRLSPSVNTDRGVSITIDQAQPIIRPFERSYANGCTAHYEAGAELVEQLKQGRTLIIEAVDKANSPTSLSLPLAGFAATYDGPAQNTPAPVRAQHEPTEADRKTRSQCK
jgi:hypothetical protein